MKFRAFIAVEVDPGEEAAPAWEAVAGSGADVKMVKPENVHITLRFLGDTEESLVGDIGALMEEAVKGVEPFEVALKGMGVFPKPSYIKVVWLGMEGAEPLGEIARKLEEGVRKLGFKKEKPFRPHLTVARLRSARNTKEVAAIVEDNADTAFGKFPVNRIVLKKSVLTPQGPIYSDVKVVELGG